MKLESLSKDAQYLARSMFWMMTPGKGELKFAMQQSRPTARTQAALDELVCSGLVSVKPFNQFGGVVYTPMVEFNPYHDPCR